MTGFIFLTNVKVTVAVSIVWLLKTESLELQGITEIYKCYCNVTVGNIESK